MASVHSLHELIVQHLQQVGVDLHLLHEVRAALNCEDAEEQAATSMLHRAYCYAVDGSLRVEVNNLQGRLCCQDVTPVTTVAELKLAIQKNTGIEAHQQQLVLHERILKDTQDLYTAGVSALDACITLVLNAAIPGLGERGRVSCVRGHSLINAGSWDAWHDAKFAGMGLTCDFEQYDYHNDGGCANPALDRSIRFGCDRCDFSLCSCCYEKRLAKLYEADAALTRSTHMSDAIECILRESDVAVAESTPMSEAIECILREST